MSEFIKDLKGKKDLFGIFEDDGDIGYLYIYSPKERKIYTDLIIYNRTSDLQPTEDDIKIVWSNDGSKCGVYVWNKLRGYIDIVTQKRERLKFTSPESPGLTEDTLKL